MLPGRVWNPGPLTYESGALPIALRGPASSYLSKKVGLLVASFRILGRLFQIFFTWIISGARLVTFSAGASYYFG